MPNFGRTEIQNHQIPYSMSHQDTVRPLWSIVRNNNSLFPRKRQLKQFEAQLQVACEAGTPSDLVELMTLYLCANKEQKMLIAQSCLPWLRRLSCEEILKLDEPLRHSITYLGWENKNMSCLTQDTGLFELCIFACHPNGHFRGRAVIALTKFTEPLALSLALLRCNDWVTPVRLTAKDSAFSIIARINIDDLLKIWEVFSRVSQGQRHRDIALNESLFPILKEKVPRKLLHRQLQSGDNHVRRYAAEVMWHTQESLDLSDLQALCACSDPYICFRTLRNILPKFDRRIRKPLLDLVRKKKWAPARLERLRILIHDDSSNSRDELVAALCDRSATIRNFAHFHLKGNPSIDIHAHYLTKLESPNVSERIAALQGLHETGFHNAPTEAETWLSHTHPRIIACALNILTPELISKHEKHILTLLTETSPQVCKAAYNALCKSPPLAQTIQHLLENPHLPEHSYGYLAKLLLLQNRWETLVHAMRLCRHDQENVRDLGINWLPKWLYGQRTFWVTPSETDLKNIQDELELSANTINDRLAEEIRFLIKSYA